MDGFHVIPKSYQPGKGPLCLLHTITTVNTYSMDKLPRSFSY